MKITYEQAVRLKDAGFPQPGDVEQHSTDPRYENGVYIPTIYELEVAVHSPRLVNQEKLESGEVVVLSHEHVYQESDLDALVEKYIAQKHNVD